MRLCSFNLQCEQFKIDFIPIKKQELYKLFKKEKQLESYFPISQSESYYLTFSLSIQKYNTNLQEIQANNLLYLVITLSVVFLFSVFFSLYALYPLRTALTLTQEFIKDILHDFNTPLASLRINSYMLKRELGENEKVLRIEQGVENIVSLQENLKAYLYNYQQTQEDVNLKELLTQRVALIQKNYDDITFTIDVKSINIQINRDAFTRICDNIITNGAKYNKSNGSLHIFYNQDKKTLSFKDTGKGIKNPHKIFERFYKEQERGIGIGLHIVKKLCDELKININVKSKVNVGTTFELLLTHY